MTAAREVIDQGLRQTQDAGNAAEALLDALPLQAAADLLEGDLDAAFRRFRALEPIVASMTDQDAHALVSSNEVVLLQEMGRDAEARVTARDFLARHDAWEPSSDAVTSVVDDDLVAIASYLRRARILSKSEIDAVRTAEIERWLKRARTSEERGLVWVMAYAAPSATPEEGQEALAALPSFGGLPGISPRPLVNALVGHALLLAGRIDDAIPRLERAVGACDLLLNGWPHLRADYELGRAREAGGVVPAACAAYASVLARWGSAKPRSITGEKALLRSKALRCGK